jgi:hypothetical protein
MALLALRSLQVYDHSQDIGDDAREGFISKSGEEVAYACVSLWTKRRKAASPVGSVSASSEHLVGIMH